MSEVLTELVIGQIQSLDTAATAKAFNIRTTNKSIEQIMISILNKSAEISRDAYKSKVPVDTGLLRDRFIKVLQKASLSSPIALIGVASGDHQGNGGRRQATLLAQMLDAGLGEERGQKLHRTRNSEAIAPFTAVIVPGRGVVSTANWIASGRVAATNVRRRYLSIVG